MRKINLLVSLAVSAALAAPLAHADNPGDTTIGGLIYTDLTSVSTTQDQTSGNVDKDPNGFGLDVKRGYFIVNHSFDDVWSSNLTTDFNFASYKDTSTSVVTGGLPTETVTTTTTTTTPETQLFIKKLYVQGKFDDMATMRVGSADMPWIPFAESIYGYRFVENTLIDRTIAGGSFGNSADWGVNLNGKSDMVNYSVSMVNGGGYKNPSRSKSMDFEGRVAFTPLDGALTIALGAYTGKRGLDTEAKPAVNTASRQDLLVAWKNSGLTVGLEWFSADKWNDVQNTGTTTKSDGTSVFASYDFPATEYSVFGRYDDVKPTKDTDSSQEDKYYNAGFAWKTNPNITWALVYKSDKLTDNLKLKNTSDDLKTQEFGLWAQIKF
ncbi:MAG TPA: carbohydrate porin [Gammaproteobacteria bacterium]|nr:carbohydrate porin [Gammaproteobacteria bacterium]